jgi:hypothetical protein
LISNSYFVLNVVFFLWGDTPASEFYVPMFRNTVCSIVIGGEDGPEFSEMLAHKIQMPGNHPNKENNYL